MKVFNVLDGDLEPDAEEPDGYRSPYAKVGARTDAKRLGGTVVLLGRDEWVCPYHYEVIEEEWLLVLAGVATVRTPDGEEAVGNGEVVCFPRGPAGAHQIGNTADDPLRILIISERSESASTVYPNSDKVGVFGPDLRHLFRRADARDYWDGEPDPNA